MALSLRYAVRSDLGLVRGNNEDSVYAGPRLLAIADGMGGHAAGEVASKIVIATMEPLDDDHVPGDLIAALRSAVLEANQRIADAVGQNRELDGMGTTLTALRFAGSQVALVHVGDSRAYLLRGGELSQITHDDTYVQYLVDSGKLTPDEAKDHPRKSVILRALRGAEVDPDVSIREAQDGDRYLLCSDGLSDVVSIETMHEALQIPDPQESADRLVELALRSGGPDNVTVIVADVVNARRGEVFDDVPVRDGAFVDPAAHEASPDDSPAERAAAMSRPRREPAAARAHQAQRMVEDPCDHRRHPGADLRRPRRHLRLGADAVLRRQGRQRGRHLPGCQRLVRADQVLRGVPQHRPEDVPAQPGVALAGRVRHHREQQVRRRAHRAAPARRNHAAVPAVDRAVDRAHRLVVIRLVHVVHVTARPPGDGRRSHRRRRCRRWPRAGGRV